MESINYADKKAHINNTILVPIIFCFVLMHPSSSSILPVHPPQEGNSMVSRLLCAMEQRKKENNLPWEFEDGVVEIEYLHLRERKVGHSLTAVKHSSSLWAVRLWEIRRFKIWYPHHFFSLANWIFSGGAFNLGCGL